MNIAVDIASEDQSCTKTTISDCELTSYGRTLSAMLDTVEASEALATVQASLASVLHSASLTGGAMPACCETRHYGRELMYLDAAKRFTILVLRWLPGAATRIHGHAAWGIVGVHSGNLTIRCYDLVDDTPTVEETMHVVGGAGDISAVGPAPEGIHAISNESEGEAYSVHIYGMDLSEEPEGINVYYE